MRIAYLDPHPVPGNDTEALQILYTVDALGQAGASVTLITPEPTADAPDIIGRTLSPKVTLMPMDSSWWASPLVKSNKPFYRAACEQLRELRVDMVLVRNLKMAEYILREIPNVALIFETHEPFALTYMEDHPHPTLLQQLKLSTLRKREEFVYRQATGLIAVPPFLADEIKQSYGIDAVTATIPNGVDLEQAANVKDVLRNPAPMLLYLGSLHPWKGVPVLVGAMAHVQHTSRLHIVGGNIDRIIELGTMSTRLGVQDRVIFEGPVKPAERFQCIHRADICLLPLTATGIGSQHTSPIKLFEYMAMGKPIIVSDLPSTRALLEDGKHALMTPVGDVRAMAKSIDKLLTDPKLRKTLAANAKQRARDFTWQKRAEKILEFAEERMRHHKLNRQSA